MATSLPLPDGGHGRSDTHGIHAPRVSARKRAVSEAPSGMTPKLGLPRSKVSAKAEKGAGMNMPPKASLPPSKDIAGHSGIDTQAGIARNGGGQTLGDAQKNPAPSEDSASPSGGDTQPSTARSKGGRRALLKDSSGHSTIDTQSGRAGAGGHLDFDNQNEDAAQDLAGHTRFGTHIGAACEGEGRPAALPQLLTEIRLKHRLRQDYQRARQRLNLQLLAMCCRAFSYRTTDAEATRKKALAAGAATLKLAKKGKADIGLQLTLAPMLAALKLTADFEKIQTKYLETSTDGLPAAVLAWADSIRGFGRLGLAQIIGECGDLSLYANPGKVWKRMGLAVFDGKSQRKCTDKAKAEQQGYSPSRHSIMHVIGVSLICGNKDYLRGVYEAEKLRQEQLYPHLTLGHRDKKARRYMQKRLLRELWRQWRGAITHMMPTIEVPLSKTSGLDERPLV